jgi:hypothetical protein
MAIVIDDIPQWQALNIASGMMSWLSMSVSGLDETQLGQVTACLGGSNSTNFVDPPQVNVLPSGTGDPDTVILTLTGTVGGGPIIGIGIALGRILPEDPELTVTITQDGQGSAGPALVTPIYINFNIPILEILPPIIDPFL